MIKRTYISGVLVFCMLCSVTLFALSQHFVNEEITPKWLGLMLFIGIEGVVWSMLNRKVTLPAKQILLILSCFFLFIFVRNWITLNFNPSSLIIFSGLLLLFFLLQQTVSACSTLYLFGTVVSFSFALSLYGVLQYFGLISSGNTYFPVTGSFDNPAGFAAALACTLPMCFQFFKIEKKYLKYAAIVEAAIMALAVILSGSRAGILSIAITIGVWIFVQSKIVRYKSLMRRKTALLIAIIFLSTVLYFFKKDSADGRLLIWRCTLDMVVDKPIFGHGKGAFQAKYMIYQAEYFKANPDSRYAQLADNALHPFNEYLLILCEHGITGLCVVVLLVFLLIKAYRSNQSNEKLPALVSLLALSIFSFFSYPFKYPFTWVLLFLNLTVIYNFPNACCNNFPLFVKKRNLLYRFTHRIILFLLFAGFFIFAIFQWFVIK